LIEEEAIKHRELLKFDRGPSHTGRGLLMHCPDHDAVVKRKKSIGLVAVGEKSSAGAWSTPM